MIRPRIHQIVILLASSIMACTSSGEADDTLDVRAFRIVDQIDGWTETANSYVEFDASTLYDLINGGAQPHVDNGLVDGFVQELESTGDGLIEVYVEKFNSDAGAQSMFELKTSSPGETLPLASAPTSTALASRILGGAAVYAHWGQFYFAMTVTGYAEGEEAAAAADVFLNYYADLASS